MSESNYQLRVDINGDGHWASFGDTVPFENGTRVIITMPDGTEEGFTFEPTVDDNLFGIPLGYQPAFVPDPGVTDTLTVPSVDGDLFQLGNEYISGDGTEYNPAKSEFGDTYTLTNYIGHRHHLRRDVRPGADRVGPAQQHADVRLERHLFQHRPGRHVRFATAQGRITSITDPERQEHHLCIQPGGRPRFRDGSRWQRHASSPTARSQPHFLTRSPMPWATSVLSGQYNTSGRLTQITNADGPSATLTYNLSNSQRVGDSTGQHRVPPPTPTTARACSPSRSMPTAT